MLAKRYRLPVQNLRKKIGQTTKSRYFLLKVFAPVKSYSRAGIVISKKVAAKATARNKIKRSVFDWFQKNINYLPVKDYLIILSPAAAQINKQELLDEFSKILNSKT